MTFVMSAMLVIVGSPFDGGPDYAAIAGMQKPRVILAPPEKPQVLIEGEAVDWALDLDVWLRLADCEWRTGWHERTTGNGFYGRGQWLLSTWRSLTVTQGYAYPDEAPISVQIQAMRENLDRAGGGVRGWRSQWPGCARSLGYA